MVKINLMFYHFITLDILFIDGTFFITQDAGHVIILARLLLLGKVSDNMAALNTTLALKINKICKI
jgi:hypothetical protein